MSLKGVQLTQGKGTCSTPTPKNVVLQQIGIEISPFLRFKCSKKKLTLFYKF